MIHVYLDDLRPCPQGFTLAKDVKECILLLQEFEVDILSLDHDLGWSTMETGMDVVIWLTQQRKFPKNDLYSYFQSLGLYGNVSNALHGQTRRDESIPSPNS